MTEANNANATTAVNPLKTDADLLSLLKRLDGIHKFKTFQRWKARFLDRLESFLYEAGMGPADESCQAFSTLLQKQIRRGQAVQAHVAHGELNAEKKTVKAALALNEMCTLLTNAVQETELLIPANTKEEKQRGYTKFHLGAVLIRQGFHQYQAMQAIDANLQQLSRDLEQVADKQQQELFHMYQTQVQRFCDVMADLNLYEVMKKCLQFAQAPEEEESSDEEPIVIQIAIHTHDGKKLTLTLDQTETIGNIKESIVAACGIPVERQVLTFQDTLLNDPDATLVGCGIPDQSELKVEPFRIPITVKTMDGVIHSLQVDPTDYLTSVKQQLAERTGIAPNNQNLTLQGAPLDDLKTVSENGIAAESQVEMEPKVMNLNVTLPGGKIAVVAALPSDTVEDLKEKIANQTGLAVPRQVIKVAEQTMPVDQPLRDLGLNDGSDIVVDLFQIPVQVKTMDGKSILLMIEPSKYLSDMKRQLEAESGLHAGNMQLSRDDEDGNAEVLDNDMKTAQDYDIRANAVLDLVPKKMPIQVRLPGEKEIKVEISPSDSADVIKQAIADKSGLAPSRQKLMFQGEELPLNETARTMGLQPGDLLQVEFNKVPILVKTMDGRQIKVDIHLADTIGDIKKDLEVEIGLPANNIQLFLDGNVLDNDKKTAKDYGVEAGSELDLEPKSIALTVELPDGKTISLDVSPQDTTHDLKVKIQAKCGLAPERQVVCHEGKELPPDGIKVREMGIPADAMLQVKLHKIPIVVKTMDGRKIQVDVEPATTLADLKKQLQDEAGITAANIALSMDGNPLDDDGKSLDEYGIQAGSELDLEPRSIAVTVELPDGTKHPVTIRPNDTTGNLKQAIEDATGIQVPRQVVHYQGSEIKPDQTVRSVGIPDGATLQVDFFKIPIVVNCVDGSQLHVNIEPTATLSDIKKVIEQESGVPAINQSLSVNDSPLEGDNSKTAVDYGIHAGSEIDMEPNTIRLQVKLPDGSTVSLSVRPADTTGTIKELIHKETGIAPPRQSLHHTSGEPLSGNKTIREMNLKDGSTIQVALAKVPVTVKSADGRETELMVDLHENLVAIKEQVEREFGLPVSNQNLLILDRILKDNDRPAKDQGVVSGSILYMEQKLMTISAILPDGTQHELQVQPSDLVDSVSDQIARVSDLASHRQVLKLDSRTLNKVETLRDARVLPDATIHVSIYTIPITVQTEDNKSYDLNVEPTSMISDLKKTLEEKTGIDDKKQILMYNETELKMGTIKAGGLLPKSVVHLSIRKDSIIFVDVKCGTLFAVDRDEVIERKILTANQGNRLDFLEATQDSKVKENMKKAMLSSPSLGVAPQVVVVSTQVDDYELEEAAKVASMWGVSLKKREKNKKGEEFIFVDPKTGACGELSRKRYLDMTFITLETLSNGEETVAERETDTMTYDKYVMDIRRVFDIKSAT
jgi:hypothetical protein